MHHIFCLLIIALLFAIINRTLNRIIAGLQQDVTVVIIEQNSCYSN